MANINGATIDTTIPKAIDQIAVDGGQVSLPSNAGATSATTGTVVGNDYVAQTPAGTNPAGTVNTPVNNNYTAPTVTQSQPAANAGLTVQGYLQDLLSQDSAYMRNATQQGLNQAASRGLRNSSIAAGNAQAAAISGANPILNNIMSLNNQREQQSFQGEQAQFDRDLTISRDNANMAHQAQMQNAQQAYQSEQAALDRTQVVNNKILDSELQSKAAKEDYQFKTWLQDSQAKQQDWLNSQQYSREFNGMLSQMNMKTAQDLFQTIMQAAVNDPQTFPADVAAGMQNFFTGNWASIMQKYFPKAVG